MRDDQHIVLALTPHGRSPSEPEHAMFVSAAERAGIPITTVGPDIDPTALANLAAVARPTGLTLLVTNVASRVTNLPNRESVIRITVDPDASLAAEPQCGTVRRLPDLHPLFDLGPDAALFVPFRYPCGPFAAFVGHRCERIAEMIEIAGGMHIAGAGTIGRKILAEAHRAGITVRGFIDNDPARQGTVVSGLPVHAPHDVERFRAVVVPASGLHAFNQTRELQAAGFERLVSPSEFFRFARSQDQPEPEYLDDLWANRWRYITLFLALADDESRRVLEGIVRHRLSLQLAPLASIMDPVHTQWFDPKFLSLHDEHVFVDGGAFDGETVLRFAKAARYRYCAIHAFEADPTIAARGSRNVAGLRNVTMHAMALGSDPGSNTFSTTGLTDGRIGSIDGVVVPIDTLDRVVRERITYLKLDVEGSEADAIDGARDHIVRDRPLVATAVYHRAPDLWALAARLTALGPFYKLFLRHYTQVAFETVLYAVPS